MEVKLVASTIGRGELEGKSAQDVISYCARVSNPSNQDKFDTASGLLRYCIKNKHWSIFEHATLTLEINTTRGISPQILRHRSFCFQEFSQRYCAVDVLGEIPIPELRRQDNKNRQNSIDDLDPELVIDLNEDIRDLFIHAQKVYSRLLENHIANESARFVLPLAVPTRIYMTGNVRNWIHYIALREKNGTQKEHQLIVKDCKKIFCSEFPDIAEALGGVDSEWLVEAPVAAVKIPPKQPFMKRLRGLPRAVWDHLRGA